NNTGDGFSTHRIDFTEGTQTTSGGNGVTGSDETSENLDSTWTDNSVPTPNGPWDAAVAVGEDESQIPEEFALYQNYPNPFNPNTTIQYGVPTQSRVSLKLYNILGQQIASLVDEVKDAGYFKVEWNGKNRFGSQIASGVYFYRLEAKAVDGGQVFTDLKKLLLLK
ncbi:MAG: T9SS type A sorting domain-containing protein, partial [Ignavibacteria bacterium]|nr:T9SS type A sorting domain-containing protein [Ignavibacteria bacterium]